MKSIDNKEGYKETKLGWIPEEWKVVKVEEIAKVGNGTTPSKKNSDYWTSGKIPWLPTGKVNDRIIVNADQFITQKALDETSLNILPLNTVLIGMVGQGKTRGMTALLNLEATINQNFAYLISNSLTDPIFLFFKLTFDYKQLRGTGRGGGKESLNCGIIKSYKIALPSLPEQQKIATILSTWDKAIDKLNTLIDAKEKQKKGLMHRLLSGKVRLKGFRTKWKEVRLASLVERVTTRNSEIHDNVVTISAQRGFIRQEDYFNKRVASKTLSNYYLVNKGDFCYNKSYSKGYPMGAFKRLEDYDHAVVTTLYICFRPITNRVFSDFLLHYFETGLMINDLMKIAQEGGRAHGLLNISLSDFFNLKLTIPPLKEQIAIGTILNLSNQELAILKLQKEGLEQEKKGLMQKLLSGKTRVKIN